jgi:hypothetical protein
VVAALRGSGAFDTSSPSVPVHMRIIVPMIGSVWPAVHAATPNMPHDECPPVMSKEYDQNRSEWYVNVEGQQCLFV